MIQCLKLKNTTEIKITLTLKTVFECHLKRRGRDRMETECIGL